MQRELREDHLHALDKEHAEKFTNAYASRGATGGLLRPHQPGNVMARLVLAAPAELNGKFLKYVNLLAPI